MQVFFYTSNGRCGWSIVVEYDIVTVDPGAPKLSTNVCDIVPSDGVCGPRFANKVREFADEAVCVLGGGFQVIVLVSYVECVAVEEKMGKVFGLGFAERAKG